MGVTAHLQHNYVSLRSHELFAQLALSTPLILRSLSFCELSARLPHLIRWGTSLSFNANGYLCAHPLRSPVSPPPAASVLPLDGLASLVRKAEATDSQVRSVVRQALVGSERPQACISAAARTAIILRVLEMELLRKLANQENVLTIHLLLLNTLGEIP